MIVQTRFDHYVVLYNTWGKASVAAAIAAVVAYADHHFASFQVTLPLAYVSLLAGSISILLAFKTNSAYERWWEARTLWGALVNDSRTWLRQSRALPTPGPADAAAFESWRTRMALRHVAFLHAVRATLRAREDAAALAGLLTAEEAATVVASVHAPTTILGMQADALREARGRGWIDGFSQMLLEQTLARLTDAMGGCERIKRTPFPRQYDDFAQLMVWLLCIVFPFALVSDVGLWTVPCSAVVAFAFQVLDGVGRNIQDPFEGTIHDTPMTTICRNIEREARASLGDAELPPPLLPVRGILM